MTAVGPKQLGKQVEIFQSGSSRNVSMKLVVVWSELIVICPWVVNFVIVYPPGYLEEQLAQSLP